MAKPVNPKLHPACDEFDPVEAGKHLTARINSFTHPGGLGRYWSTGIVQLRLKAMPERWRNALQRRYEDRLDAILEHGPDHLPINQSKRNDMKLNQVFPSNYLKADDLQGREVKVRISKCAIEKIGDEQKLIAYFTGKDKGLVLNKTNANRIAHYFGDDTDHWIGKEITLGAELVEFQGKTVEAIRVKGATKSDGTADTTAPDQPFSDSIPF